MFLTSEMMYKILLEHAKYLYISGKPGIDYPILGAVPYTNFYCDEQAYPGFFADMETRCQSDYEFYIMYFNTL